MPSSKIEVGEEVGAKKAFVWAVDWPGWCRSGKTVELARAALIAYAPRYAAAIRRTGLSIPNVEDAVVETVERVEGGGGTDFGVPSVITKRDRRAVDKAEADRLALLVVAAWGAFEQFAAGAPAALRKGPRGGGRDRDKMIAHVVEADDAYAREIGIRMRAPDPHDREAVAAERAAILEVLRKPSDGSPLADRKWTLRYAVRRIAWHALDHAWEMEDRSEPA